jgi:hypothetical protein
MATAIVPLILGIAPQIISLIVGLVHHQAPVAEAQMGAGTGAVKFADVFLYVMDGLTKAHAAGTLGGDLPAPDLVKVLVQTLVTSLKGLGLLTADAAGNIAVVAAPAPSGVQPGALSSGQSLIISVK